MKLKKLPYDFGALAPALSEQQLRLHWDRNHRSYVEKVNMLLDGPSLTPEGQRDLDFAISGAKLHDVLWKSYVPGGAGEACPELEERLWYAAEDVKGSGWAAISRYKGPGPERGEVWVHQVENHDYPWKSWTPLLLVDVWEHAYAHDYWNDREAYLEAIMPHLDWRRVR